MTREEIRAKIDATRLKNLRAQRASGMPMKPINVTALKRLEAEEQDRKRADRRQRRKAKRNALLNNFPSYLLQAPNLRRVSIIALVCKTQAVGVFEMVNL